MIFEIHLTASGPNIHEAAKHLGIKTIEVDLLRPDLSVLRTEHMTSYTREYSSVADCITDVDNVVDKLGRDGVKLIRQKVETPVYSQFLDVAMYIESHYVNNEKPVHPASRNRRKTDILITEREYKKSRFKDFADRFKRPGVVTELCLFDTFVKEDKDWFDLYVNS